jgi:chromate transporter
MERRPLSAVLRLFLAFARVGIFGYGGGPSMLPLIEEEVVEVHQWMTIEEFANALAMGNALPGPIAIKMSGYVGLKVAGLPGVVAAVMGVALPSLIAMLVLSALFFRFKDLPQVQSVLRAVRPAVVALLFFVVYHIFPRSVTSWHTALIALVAFAAVAWLNIHPALMILMAGVVGLIVY